MRWPRSPKVIVGLVIIGIFVLLTVIGPWIAPYTPSSSSFVPNQAPSAAHWLGTTALGQDILSQLLVGARATMVVGLVAGLVATALSVMVGVTAGYLGGTADDGLSLASNVFLAIPGLPLLIVIDSYLPQADRSNSVLIGAVIALTGWAWGARVLRALTMSLRNRDFVEASRIIGEGRLRIIVSEVVPNVLPVIAASFLFTMLYSIGIFVALAYLGVTSTAVWNWGTMLYWAQANNAPLVGQWYWFVPPGLCIALVGMALALVNFGIDEFIDPRLRGGGLSGRLLRRSGLPRHPKIGFTPVLPRQATPRQELLPGTDLTGALTPKGASPPVAGGGGAPASLRREATVGRSTPAVLGSTTLSTPPVEPGPISNGATPGEGRRS